MEIVSPILQYVLNSNWCMAVKHLWAALDQFCSMETNQSCGTHVHLSPQDNVIWDIESLKCVCRAVIYFEGAFELLVPEHRRGNAYMKSFFADHPEFRGRSAVECFTLIDRSAHRVDIAELMNPEGDRNYAWNFRNLIYGGKMTIEFRRGPGVTETTDCLAWVELVVSFARSARALGKPNQLHQYTQDVQGLQQFIDATLVPSISQPTLVTPIFANKQGSLVPRSMHTLTAELSDRLERKKVESDRNNKMIKKIRKS